MYAFLFVSVCMLSQRLPLGKHPHTSPLLRSLPGLSWRFPALLNSHSSAHMYACMRSVYTPGCWPRARGQKVTVLTSDT